MSSSSAYIATKEAHVNGSIAAFVASSSTPGLPDSYIVLWNGDMYPVIEWLTEEREPTEDIEETWYVTFLIDDERTGTLDLAWYGIDLGHEMVSWDSH